jgi:hypothetical protein
MFHLRRSLAELLNSQGLGLHLTVGKANELTVKHTWKSRRLLSLRLPVSLRPLLSLRPPLNFQPLRSLQPPFGIRPLLGLRPPFSLQVQPEKTEVGEKRKALMLEEYGSKVSRSSSFTNRALIVAPEEGKNKPSRDDSNT